MALEKDQERPISPTSGSRKIKARNLNYILDMEQKNKHIQESPQVSANFHQKN